MFQKEYKAPAFSQAYQNQSMEAQPQHTEIRTVRYISLTHSIIVLQQLGTQVKTHRDIRTAEVCFKIFRCVKRRNRMVFQQTVSYSAIKIISRILQRDFRINFTLCLELKMAGAASL